MHHAWACQMICNNSVYAIILCSVQTAHSALIAAGPADVTPRFLPRPARSLVGVGALAGVGGGGGGYPLCLLRLFARLLRDLCQLPLPGVQFVQQAVQIRL